MHDTLPSAPSRTEVRSALLWALEHDRDALLEHRETTQHCAWPAARGAADRRLVRRWRAAAAPVPSTVARPVQPALARRPRAHPTAGAAVGSSAVVRTGPRRARAHPWAGPRTNP